jgi:hypothetical protein
MKQVRNLVIGAVSVLALSAIPINLDRIALGSFELSSAHAKGDKGGGNGNGHGDRGGSGEHGKSAGAGGSGKSADARSKSADTGSGAVFSKNQGAKKAARIDVKAAMSGPKALRAQQVAALPESVPAPQPKPKEKTLQARLAGLNSLKRNYHAYLNSQSPKMASVKAFVMASAEFDLAREKLDAATAKLSLARTGFESLLTNTKLTPYDGAVGVYDDPTLADLAARLEHLQSATVAPEDQQAWEAEVAALKSVLDSTRATDLANAEDAVDQAQLAADEASVGTDDEALKQALLDAANKNRVAQYGPGYIDGDIMDWAKNVLGVGDAYGKIDQVRETLDTE